MIYKDNKALILDHPYLYEYEVEEEMEGLQIHMKSVRDIYGHEVDLDPDDMDCAMFELKCFEDDKRDHEVCPQYYPDSLKRMLNND